MVTHHKGTDQAIKILYHGALMWEGVGPKPEWKVEEVIKAADECLHEFNLWSEDANDGEFAIWKQDHFMGAFHRLQLAFNALTNG